MVRIGGFARLQKIVERLGVSDRGKLAALLRRESHNAVPAFRRFYYAPDGGNPGFFQRSGHHAIGGDHKIFNQLRGAVLLLLLQVNDLVIEDYGMNFSGFNIERAVAIAFILERLRHFILQFELCL